MKNLVTTIDDDGSVKISESEVRPEALEEPAGERQSVTGYWRCTKPKCLSSESHTPYFNITSPQHVKVRTEVRGSVSVTINFYNVTGNHGGPSLPQTGGDADLAPGYWKMYFTGSLNSGYPRGIKASVTYK